MCRCQVARRVTTVEKGKVEVAEEKKRKVAKEIIRQTTLASLRQITVTSDRKFGWKCLKERREGRKRTYGYPTDGS